MLFIADIPIFTLQNLQNIKITESWNMLEHNLSDLSAFGSFGTWPMSQLKSSGSDGVTGAKDSALMSW